MGRARPRAAMCDGAKRDRRVWSGDLPVEGRALFDILGRPRPRPRGTTEPDQQCQRRPILASKAIHLLLTCRYERVRRRRRAGAMAAGCRRGGGPDGYPTRRPDCRGAGRAAPSGGAGGPGGAAGGGIRSGHRRGQAAGTRHAPSWVLACTHALRVEGRSTFPRIRHGHPQKAASDRVQPHRGVSRTEPLTCTSPQVRGSLPGHIRGWGGWGSNPRPADYESAALTC